MYKRWIAALLALCILGGAVPTALAHGGTEGNESEGPPAAVTYNIPLQPTTEDNAEGMKLSEEGIDFIKIHEGFTPYATWDFSQYSIGYGTGCNPDDYPDGITEEEADLLLRSVLPTYETPINDYMRRMGLTFNQHEFDSLVIFTYGCGPGWLSGCRLESWLRNRGSELDLVDAFVAWCHANGDVLPGLVRRRILEAQIFLYGDYVGDSSPQYMGVCFYTNGGTLLRNNHGTIEEVTRGHDIFVYPIGEAYGAFPEVRNGACKLSGWYTEDGTQVTESDIANQSLTHYLDLYAHWELPFTDVSPNAWYYNYVQETYARNLFAGLSDTEFGPEGVMTRAMLVSVLYRLDGRASVKNKTTPFTDVEEGSWYARSVAWAYETGVVSGMSPTTFGPEEPVSREQLAAILYRYAKYKGYDVTGAADLSRFADADETHTFGIQPLRWAVDAKIVSGSKADGKRYLNPRGSATRAQVATMVIGFLERYGL